MFIFPANEKLVIKIVRYGIIFLILIYFLVLIFLLLLNKLKIYIFIMLINLKLIQGFRNSIRCVRSHTKICLAYNVKY